jgi:hypothetical protein
LIQSICCCCCFFFVVIALGAGWKFTYDCLQVEFESVKMPHSKIGMHAHEMKKHKINKIDIKNDYEPLVT